jgi:hypothetical protein
MDGASVSGQRFTSAEGSTPRASEGRVCEEAGCDPRLSIYNDSAWCSLHAPMVTPRTRGRKIDAA